METRIEKRKRLKKENRKRTIKLAIIGFAIYILYFGIRIVNENIVYLDYFKNPTIFKINFEERKIDLFGSSYIIDLKIFKKKN